MANDADRLIYVIATETLKGQVSGKQLQMKAVSGGGRGSTQAGTATNSLASFDPRKPTTGADSSDRGGSLPPGLWWVYPPEWKDNKHPSLGVWVSYVEPTGNQADKFGKRTYDKTTGFFIHGAGKRGSNGCLVIASDARKELLKAIEAADGVPLEVVLSEQRYSPQDLMRYALRESWRDA